MSKSYQCQACETITTTPRIDNSYALPMRCCSLFCDGAVVEVPVGNETTPSYGYYCWNRNRVHGSCDAEISAPSEREAAILANQAGWVLGHYDGQAHFSCPDCAAALMGIYGPIKPLEDM